LDDEMDNLKLSACGIDCAECASYKATVHQDTDAARSLVDWYKGMGWIGGDDGVEAVMAKSPLCRGCWGSNDDCFFKCGCGQRDFRICCIERKINHCGECGDFPCEHYKEWVSWGEAHQKAMDNLISLKTNT